MSAAPGMSWHGGRFSEQRQRGAGYVISFVPMPKLTLTSLILRYNAGAISLTWVFSALKRTDKCLKRLSSRTFILDVFKLTLKS